MYRSHHSAPILGRAPYAGPDLTRLLLLRTSVPTGGGTAPTSLPPRRRWQAPGALDMGRLPETQPSSWRSQGTAPSPSRLHAGPSSRFYFAGYPIHKCARRSRDAYMFLGFVLVARRNPGETLNQAAFRSVVIDGLRI
jgi:hypothetical protein